MGILRWKYFRRALGLVCSRISIARSRRFHFSITGTAGINSIKAEFSRI